MSAIEIGSDHRARVAWEVLDGQRETEGAQHQGVVEGAQHQGVVEGAQHQGVVEGAQHQDVAELTQLVAQLRSGMASRQLIGIATGLVAGRFGCTTEQGWAVLTRVSQHTNIKLREIARVMVEAHDGRSTAEDAAILGRVSSQLPGGWPGRPTSPA